jgi:hypothetical protein
MDERIAALKAQVEFLTKALESCSGQVHGLTVVTGVLLQRVGSRDQLRRDIAGELSHFRDWAVGQQLTDDQIEAAEDLLVIFVTALQATG